MSKITLQPVTNLQTSSAATTINNNNSVVQTAMDNTLSRDGTSPNVMNAPLDMNSKQIINLPIPAASGSPLRLQDLSTFVGAGTVTNIPTGGITGQALTKNSNTAFDTTWANSIKNVKRQIFT